MGRTLAILFTLTTYGTWLRGDARGWVDRGVVYPADPPLERVRSRPHEALSLFLHPATKVRPGRDDRRFSSRAARVATLGPHGAELARPSRDRGDRCSGGPRREMCQGCGEMGTPSREADLVRRLRQAVLLRSGLRVQPDQLRGTPQLKNGFARQAVAIYREPPTSNADDEPI